MSDSNRAYLVGALLIAVFTFAALRICGLRMVLDIILSPLRTYDFDKDEGSKPGPKTDEAIEAETDPGVHRGKGPLQ